MANFGTDDTHLATSLQRAAELVGLRQLEKAEECLRAILATAPAFTRASILLANCLELQSHLRDATAILTQAARYEPANRDLLHYLARLHTLVGEHEQAIGAYEKLLADTPSDTAAAILCAQVYRTVGRKSESVEAFRQAIHTDPGNGAAWWSIANYFPAEISASDVDQMREALSHRRADPKEAGPLLIALGLVADRRGDHQEAFARISEGKRMRAALTRYDPDWVTAEVDRAIARLPAERVASGEDSAPAASGPIFLVGMPRSGSTLLERVLGEHSAIEAAGELPLINAVVERVKQRCADGGDFYSVLGAMPPEELAELGQWYLDRSSDYRRSGKPFFIDKWNSNWLHAGLIRLILPQAPIIDLRRDALDCCWSNFKMLFGSGLAFSNELSHLGRFYCDYVRLMDWIGSLAPARVRRLAYEAMVENLELAARTTLEFLGLAYEPACIAFHRSSAPVATPSSEQVRQPVNRSAIGSAEPYRPWLGPLIAELRACGQAPV